MVICSNTVAKVKTFIDNKITCLSNELTELFLFGKIFQRTAISVCKV